MEFAFGETKLSLDITGLEVIATLQANPAPALPDPNGAIVEALKNPTDGSLPLAHRVRPGESVVILASDITRSVGNATLIPPILDHLNQAGIPDSQIQIIVALGTHRRQTPQEWEKLFGRQVLDRVRVSDHDCRDQANLVHVGDSSRGTPIWLNRQAVEADRVILTGGIVYHLMAGFGGGRKSVLPGISSYETVQANHRLLLNPSPQAIMASGETLLNPLHQEMEEAAALLNPDFLINVLLNGDGAPTAYVSGDWKSAWVQGCEKVVQINGVPLHERADLAIASAGGFPKDINLYQTAKTLDNAIFAVQEGGSILLISQCRDGGGAPEFFDWFQYPTPQAMAEALAQDFTVPGYVAFHCARIARKYKVVLVSDLPTEMVEKTGMLPARDIEHGLSLATQGLSSRRTVLMPKGSLTFPLLP